MDLFSDYVYGGFTAFQKNFQIPINFGEIIVYIATFTTYSLNFFVLCPMTLQKKQFLKFGVGVVILIVIFAGIRYFGEEVILFHLTGKHNYFEASRKFFFYTFDNSYFAIKGILYSTLLYMFFAFADNQNRIHNLELEYKKAELSLLKSQLEPHFLFNTLNTFYTDLIDTNPKTAKDIHRLSELLRYVTYEADYEVMSLNKELKFIEDYIYLHRARFEDTMFLEYKVEGNVNNQIVPSLVFIHFIENIFKHGIINQKDNPAKVLIRITETKVSIDAENKFLESEKYNSAGIGKDNLVKRLQAIYQNDYKLIENRVGETFKTYLELPIKTTV